jgi:predicted nucleic acid-binding protein
VKRAEPELEAAQRVLDEWLAARTEFVVLELLLYEVGNVLVRDGGRALEVAEELERLDRLCKWQYALSPELCLLAALVAEQHELSYYDAAHLALAQELGLPLVTADRALLAAGGVSPSDFVQSLN